MRVAGLLFQVKLELHQDRLVAPQYMRFKVFECCKQTLSLYLFLIFHPSIPLFLGNIGLVSSLATTYSSISGVPPIPLTKASTHSLTFRSRSSMMGVATSPMHAYDSPSTADFSMPLSSGALLTGARAMKSYSRTPRIPPTMGPTT